ncbi:hypothetical protein GCM10007276_04510 [Agaricicola taiwanensis]|uniref:Uncharacterized protein n=1 Tax=Agaricicola taiwanensis TaxID=591372 RepID=A0A8J2YF29_9RHOB|nr:hypothetical protein GCM10007276_04510 [Agaricicola taiwanensis]
MEAGQNITRNKPVDRLVIWLASIVGVCLVAAAAALWAQGGAAVFFEMLVAGIMSCF